MRSFRLPILPLLALAWVVPYHPAWAEVTADWIQSALAGNAEIQRAKAELEAALARVPQAKALPDPAIELEMMGKDAVGPEQTLRLAQAFPWPGTLGRREEVASLQAQAYWHEVQQLESEVARRVRVIVAEVSYLQRQQSLLGQNLELFRKQEEYLEQATRGGAEVSDLIRVEMESSLLADELAQTEEAIRRETADLEAILGRAIDPSEVGRITLPTGPASWRDREALLSAMDAANPGLQALALRAEAARAGIALARLGAYPEFMISAGYRRTNDRDMGGKRERMNEAVVMLSLSLPIWERKNQGRRDESAAMLRVMQSEQINASRMLRARLESLLSQGRDARRRVDLFENRLLPKARQAHHAVDASYRAGRVGLLEVFASRRMLLQAETSYWRAVADTHITRAEIDALLGTGTQTPNP